MVSEQENSMTFRLVVAATALAFAALAQAAGPDRPRPTPVIADCLDPSRVRTWESVDLDEVVVDAGRRHFHLQLGNACPELAYNHTVVFQASGGIGRICGNLGDRIVLPKRGIANIPCSISKVTPLDRRQYESYASKKRVEGEVTVRRTSGDVEEGAGDALPSDDDALR
jgi:hypothetical protein